MQVLDSFIDAALSLGSKRAGDELIGMIVRYMRTGEEPTPRTEAQAAVLIAIRPVMENSNARARAGKRGMERRWGETDNEPHNKTDNKSGNKPDNKTDNKPDNKTDNKPHNEEEEEEEEGISNDIPNPIAPYAEIVGHLNEAAGTAYNPRGRKTRSLIDARVNEGFTVEDFKAVIDAKCGEWLNDPKMCAYLRPETLFGSKFEGYLNQPGQRRKTGGDLSRYED